jgi:hypothetical protein
MKFIYVNEMVINADYIVFWQQNNASGDVIVAMTNCRIDVPFPHGSEFIRQFEAFHLGQPVPFKVNIS